MAQSQPQDALEGQGPAGPVDLYDILPGVGAGAGQVGREHLIHHLPALRVGDVPIDEAAVGELSGEEPPAIESACWPLRRTIPMPPSPMGVEMAAMVSWYVVLREKYTTFPYPQQGTGGFPPPPAAIRRFSFPPTRPGELRSHTLVVFRPRTPEGPESIAPRGNRAGGKL